MSRAYKCDRCGAYYEGSARRILYTSSTGAETYGTYDLCRECVGEFNEWLEEKQDEKS
jgi:hypothetical protein